MTISSVVQTRHWLCPCIPGVWAGSDRREVNNAEVRIKVEKINKMNRTPALQEAKGTAAENTRFQS